MTSLPSLKTGSVPTAATALLLFVLSAASLGCAYAACFGVTASTPAPRPTAPAASLQEADPMAGAGAHMRCSPGARLRRPYCRTADLPAV
ncbi:hypothetical protein [Massilia sp. TWP1-3-3]|uniref:hypothetical protein n=1 Tax=Massilia sp. TWP1-3-3 TaxID=2804573 RepID=UPI003CEF1DC9